MNNLPPEVTHLRRQVLQHPGESDVTLRQAVARFVTRKSGLSDEPAKVPAALEKYLTKLSVYAYKITDKDVAQLKTAGYSEDAIFELTVAAAVTAGVARFEQGLAALREK